MNCCVTTRVNYIEMFKDSRSVPCPNKAVFTINNRPYCEAHGRRYFAKELAQIANEKNK